MTSRIILVLLALAGSRVAAVAEDHTRGGRSVRDDAGAEVLSFSESYALLIGASEYRKWQPLPGVKRDVVELKRVFESHDFEVTLVEDPDAEELRAALATFIRAHGREETNRILVYFAGHGYTTTVHERPRGYLVPVDAPRPDEDLDSFLDKALPLHMMAGHALDIRARHAIFFFDSCFAGSVFKDLKRSSPPPPASISYVTGKPVRQFISSGSAGQEVPDRSEFRVQLVDALDGKTDLSADGYVTGTELGGFLFKSVMDAALGDQTPQYGTLEDGVYDKGDFVFVIPPKPPTAAASAETAAGVAEPLDTAGRGDSATVAVLPPTLIDLGSELRTDFGEAIVGSLSGLVAEVMGPESVSQALTPETLGNIADCEADEVCLLQVCSSLEAELAVATVFEELAERYYAVEVIVIDDTTCSLVDRTTKTANQLALLRARAEKAAKNIVSGWLQ